VEDGVGVDRVIGVFRRVKWGLLLVAVDAVPAYSAAVDGGGAVVVAPLFS
jgi:hypothetical protein